MRALLGLSVLALATSGALACGASTPTPAVASNSATPKATATSKPSTTPALSGDRPRTATVTLFDGRAFTFTLNWEKAPKTVANFVAKAQARAYDGLTFHRVEEWVLQGGDPKGDGMGGGKMPSEYNDLPFKVGSVGIARAADPAINNDMQFFVTKKDAEFLNGKYTNFGQLTSGLDVVLSTTVGTKIKTVTVTP